MRLADLRQTLTSTGLSVEESRSLGDRIEAIEARYCPGSDPAGQVQVWRGFQSLIGSTASLRERFAAQSYLYRRAYEGRPPEAGPGPAWIPENGALGRTNLGALMKDLQLSHYVDLHRWSVEHRDAFWEAAIRRLGVVFRTAPQLIRDPDSPMTRPAWLPGAVLNIAESCCRAESGKTAVLSASETDPTIRRMTYGDLRRLAARVANGLEAMGIGRGSESHWTSP